MTAIEAFQKLKPMYNEFTGDQICELDEFAAFEDGFTEGRRYYKGQVVQISSDTWFMFNGTSWDEMSVEEQIKWSHYN